MSRYFRKSQMLMTLLAGSTLAIAAGEPTSSGPSSAVAASTLAPVPSTVPQVTPSGGLLGCCKKMSIFFKAAKPALDLAEASAVAAGNDAAAAGIGIGKAVNLALLGITDEVIAALASTSSTADTTTILVNALAQSTAAAAQIAAANGASAAGVAIANTVAKETAAAGTVAGQVVAGLEQGGNVTGAVTTAVAGTAVIAIDTAKALAGK